MGYLWDRGKPQPLSYFSMMATILGNSNNASGSGQNANAANSKLKSWDKRVDELLSNLKEKNAFANNEACFFVMKRNEGDFSKTSPFLIQKAIQSIIGETKKIKKLRSGELLIEIQNDLQASNLKKCTSLANIPVSVSTHRSLNSSKGVISESDLLYVSEAEILENMKEQGVSDVHRIMITKNNNKIPTKHIILTINSPKLPQSVKAGYLECSVRPYIPNPLRCFNCQRFGHSKTSCRGTLTCGRCSAVGHDSQNCNENFSCVNCKGDHPSYSKNCEKWLKEKEIQIIRTKQNLSYPEARKIVESRTPTVGITYAAVTANQKRKKYQSIGTQTECLHNHNPQSPRIKVQPQTSKQAGKETTTSNRPMPIAAKLPLHKRTTEATSNKRQSISHTKKSNSHKQISKTLKLNSSHNTPSKKDKTIIPTKLKTKTNLSMDTEVLSLHPTDSSEDEEGMSVKSDSSAIDNYI